MDPRLAARWLISFTLLACKSERAPAPPPKKPAASPARELPPTLSVPLPSSVSPPPISSEVVAFEKQLQATKLRLPPRRAHEAHLAFARGMFGQLGLDALRVFDLTRGEAEPLPVFVEPIEAPRSLLALANGALLAIGARQLHYWEPGWKHTKSLPRPVFMPGAELYADALQADVIWCFDPKSRTEPAKLSSFRLGTSETLLPLPEQTIELASTGDQVLGVSREGVWLSLSAGRAERFAPGGERLPVIELGAARLPTWALAALRLDQSLWIDQAGQVERVQVTPGFRKLSKTKLAGAAFAADVGDEGRLLAVSSITGDGPRFELQLLDSELKSTARVVLPAEAPTGDDDWVQVVTRNQEVVASPSSPWVAVGGPERVTIFDAAGKVVFSISSQ